MTTLMNLNEDCINEIMAFIPYSIITIKNHNVVFVKPKEAKEKTKTLYHNILNKVDYATEFIVGKIYLAPTYGSFCGYNEGIGFKVIKLTKCYIWIQVLDEDFEDTMKYLPKIHKKKINNNGVLSLTTGRYSKGWEVNIYPNRCIEFQKISHLNYMFSNHITLLELMCNYKFGKVIWNSKGFMELSDIE